MDVEMDDKPFWERWFPQISKKVKSLEEGEETIITMHDIIHDILNSDGLWKNLENLILPMLPTTEKEEKMGAFNDATCPECDEHIGWMGKLTDKPDCPHCGHKFDKKKLAEIEEQIEAAIKEADREFTARDDNEAQD